ncbi:hypothetical protein D3C78_908210 [compost metagenome]
MFDQLRARHDLAHVMHEIGQQPELMRGELQRRTVDGRLGGFGVEPDRAADEFGGGMAGGAADERAHTGENLFDMERLGDVVIGAGVDARHLVAPAVAGGEDENRHGLAGRTPFFDDGNAIQLRQADIENDRVIGLGIAEIMPFLAVKCLIDNITGFFQRVGQLPIEIGIVLNNENTHYQPFPSVPARARGRSC